MLLSDFDFELDDELIALRPAAKRDFSRLLYVNPNQNEIKDYIFHDLPSLLKAGDVLVFNNSKTIRAQLDGVRPARDEISRDVAINVNLHKNTAPDIWRAFCKPAKRLHQDDNIIFSPELYATVLEKDDGGDVALRFSLSGDELLSAIDELGHMPLPPYIGLKRAVDENDETDYQTTYAAIKGSVATPTAGLHFTSEIFEELNKLGVETHFLTLHVGAGTFLPVKTENIAEHKMHSEYFEISAETANALNRAKQEGRRVICVGTTSLRSIESSLDKDGWVLAAKKETNIFLHPGKDVRFVDALISNFHLPKSTLLMLMSAFAGLENVKAAYKYAIKNKYRFFSYGDAGLWIKKVT
jgi:S-adenosylmethionine:tRNA ribosyltransferase-isomerase